MVVALGAPVSSCRRATLQALHYAGRVVNRVVGTAHLHRLLVAGATPILFVVLRGVVSFWMLLLEL